MKISAVYLIRNVVNGKRYVRSSKNALRRKVDHFGDLRRNKHTKWMFNHTTLETKRGNILPGVDWTWGRSTKEERLNLLNQSTKKESSLILKDEEYQNLEDK